MNINPLAVIAVTLMLILGYLLWPHFKSWSNLDEASLKFIAKYCIIQIGDIKKHKPISPKN